MGLRARHQIPITATAPVASEALAAPGGPPPMLYAAQTENNWCWAACAEMLLSRPGLGARSQCSIASTHLGQVCCPSPGAPSACDEGAWPHLVYPGLGIRTSLTKSPLTQAALATELAAGRPVEVCYQWQGSRSTHVALIVNDNGGGYFEVYDPSYGAGSRSFSQIASAYSLGVWIYSFTF